MKSEHNSTYSVDTVASRNKKYLYIPPKNRELRDELDQTNSDLFIYFSSYSASFFLQKIAKCMFYHLLDLFWIYFIR